MIVTSAPGKVILFGEHAVVYGKPALVGAIDKRIYVRVERRKDETIEIFSEDLKHKKTSFSLKNKTPQLPEEFEYVKEALAITFDFLDKSCGLDIKISSGIPPASGLGSSAAVSIATILAISKSLDTNLKDKEIARLGHKVELKVQGAASPTDTAIATFGGVLFVEPSKNAFERIDCSISLVIGYTGDARSTKELVKKVKLLKERNPSVIDPIIEDIGRVTREARKRLEKGEDIGELMNKNHELLEALGVSTKKLSTLVYKAREAGAMGSKLTGAGGGGSMIAYTPKNQEKVIKAIEDLGCMALKAQISKEGVRVEK